MLYLGIDQHRKHLTICICREDGQVVVQRQVSTRTEKVDAFLEELGKLDSEGCYTIVEVCGFNDWLLTRLAEAGVRETVLVQPVERSRQKSDRRDARQLCELLWINRERIRGGQRVQGLRRVMPATPTERDNRRLTAMRRNLAAQRTRVINRIKRILLRHNLMTSCPTRGIQTRRARRWLSQLPLSSIDRLELDQLLREWQLCDDHQEQLDAHIHQRALNDADAMRLMSIPGCGPYTALALACRVGDVVRFDSPRSLANYWGLTPSCRNSGEQQQRLGGITKQGSAVARFLLGQLVLHVLRRDRGMRSWYLRIKRRRGAKIARVAVMRRLAVIIWHMLAKQEAYQFTSTSKRTLTS